MRRQAKRTWAAALELVDSRRGALLLGLVALGVYGIESIGWPLAPGRDLSAYLLYYSEMWHWHAVFPWTMLTRTPVGSLVVGGALDLGSGLLVEIVAAALFVGSIFAWTATARTFGRAPALIVGVGLVFYPGYGVIFHDWTIDAPMAALFAVWVLLLVRTTLAPTWPKLLALGVGLALLVLTRPVNQVLLVVVLVPLVGAATWRRRAASVAAVAVSALALVGGWVALNGLRYDDATVARGGGAALPLFRAFITDRIVSPDNGPASQKLAVAVERGLLTREPYRSYGIDLDEFFSAGSARMQEDLIGLSDRTWGWDSDYSVLGAVGREAVRAHPGAFARGVLASYWEVLSQPLFAGRNVSVATGSQGGVAATIPLPEKAPDGTPLPVPSEGEPIPSQYQSAHVSTPEGRIHEVWTSPTEHHIVFDRQADAERAGEVDAKLNELYAVFPDRPSSAWVGLQLDHSSKLYPPPWLLVLVGVIAIAYRRPANWPLLALPTLLSLGVLFVTVLAVYGVPYYTVPLAPSFLLLAAGGLFGDRAASRSTVLPPESGGIGSNSPL